MKVKFKHIFNTISGEVPVFLVPGVKSADREDVSHIAGPAGENITALNDTVWTARVITASKTSSSSYMDTALWFLDPLEPL